MSARSNLHYNHKHQRTQKTVVIFCEEMQKSPANLATVAQGVIVPSKLGTSCRVKAPVG